MIFAAFWVEHPRVVGPADGARIGPIRPVGMQKPIWLFHCWVFVGRSQGSPLNYGVEVAMTASGWPPSVASGSRVQHHENADGVVERRVWMLAAVDHGAES